MSLFEKIKNKRYNLQEAPIDDKGNITSGPGEIEKSKKILKKFKNPYLQHLALGFIAWLKKIWIEGKIQMEMASVDEQEKEIHKGWDGYTQPRVKYVETDSEVKGLKDMSIEAYREAAKADAWLFGDYDAYESYDINTKKVSEEDESV